MIEYEEVCGLDKWIVLGIKKTKDENEIKNAYRKRLGSVNPEDDPEGFMELRKAYEDAIYEINHDDKSEDGNGDSDSDNSNEDASNEDTSFVDGNSSKKKTDENKDELTNKISTIYHNFQRRINPDEWEALFETDDFVSLETSEEAQDKLLSFLMDNYRLPMDVWNLIVCEFDIEANRSEFEKKYPADFVDFMIDSAHYRTYVNYNLFYPESNFDNVDEFIKLYFDLKSYLRNQNMTEDEIEKQTALIEAMEELGVGHPYFDVNKLFHELNVISVISKADDKEYKLECKKRLEIAEEILSENPSDFYLNIFCGDLASDAGDFEKAREYYGKLYIENKKDYLASHKLAGTLYDLGKYKEAQEIYIDLLDANESDYIAHNGMTECNKKMVEVYTEKIKEEPDNDEYKLEISWSYYRTSDFKNAIKMLNSFRPKEDKIYSYYNILGRSCFYEKDYERALSCFEAWKEAVEKLQNIDDDKLSEELIKEKNRFPYTCFWMGSCYAEMKEYEKAKEYLNTAISIEHPEIKYSYEILCKIEYELRNYEECIKISKEILDRFGNNYFAYIYMAKSFYELDELNSTIDTCEQIIKLYPYYYEAYKLEMELYEYVEQYEDIKYTIERYDATGAKSDQIDYFKAWWLGVREGKLDESNEILYRILDKKYNHENTDMDDYNNTYWLLTRNLERAGEEEKAIHYYEEVLKEEPDDIFFLNKLGDDCHIISDFERAVDCYEKVISLSKNQRNRLHAYMGKAAALSCMGRFEESIKVYEGCKDEYGYEVDTDYLIDYAELMIRMDNFAGCEKLLLDCIENVKDDNRLQSCIGNLCCFYGNENHVDKAREMFELAIKHMPEDVLIYRSMGNIYLEHEMYEEAKEMFLKGFEIDKDRDAFICQTLLIALGKTDDVFKEEYKIYRDVAMEQCEDADSVWAYTRCSEMYRGLKDYEKALDAVNKSFECKRRPLDCFIQSADAWDEKGNVYFDMGDLKNALLCYKKAVEVFGHYKIYEDKVIKVTELLKDIDN